MKPLLRSVLLTGLLSLTTAQILFFCSQNACRFGCNEEEVKQCDDGRVIENATSCGCCPVCVISLEEGSDCRPSDIGVLPRAECGESLICDRETRKCVPNIKKPCVKAAEDLKRRGSGGELAYGEPAPECDLFGDYKARRCKKGLMCHCVDKDGTRIFGTALDIDGDNMHCNCSRSYIKSPDGLFEGDRLRCLPNGNYDPLQCSDRYCYCLRASGELDGRPMFSNGSLNSLKCYNSERHGSDYESLCYKEYNKVKSIISDSKKNGTILLGYDFPNCDPDGSYAPKQCKKSKCYCVRANGRRYEDNQAVDRYSAEAESMKCNCFREKELLKSYPGTTMLVRTFLEYKCARNGNYLPLQCPNPSTCRCVDDDGFQVSADVMSKDRRTLKCYKPEYEKDIEDIIE